MKKITKSTKKTAAAPAKKTAVKAKQAAVAKKPAATKTAKVVKAAAKSAAKPAKSAKKSYATVITANVDVGFGNQLSIRGEGPGLNWDAGVLLDCIADDRWSITISGAEKPIVYKFLINDVQWSFGSDFIAQPGDNVVDIPQF